MAKITSSHYSKEIYFTSDMNLHASSAILRPTGTFDKTNRFQGEIKFIYQLFLQKFTIFSRFLPCFFFFLLQVSICQCDRVFITKEQHCAALSRINHHCTTGTSTNTHSQTQTHRLYAPQIPSCLYSFCSYNKVQN